MRQVTLLQFALFLLEALILGALIGAERQWRQRTAGLRTNALVAIGAAAFSLVAGLGFHYCRPSCFRHRLHRWRRDSPGGSHHKGTEYRAAIAPSFAYPEPQRTPIAAEHQSVAARQLCCLRTSFCGTSRGAWNAGVSLSRQMQRYSTSSACSVGAPMRTTFGYSSCTPCQCRASFFVE